ncbi:uncharacterized protein, partial [Chaetodon trifascialis]|uniref:uncharacterized protein n=1 Tax=Chaetodon trifascialis TaxID=109706 RepID=UPI0039960AF2
MTTATSTAGPASSANTASTNPPTANEGTLGLQFSLNQPFTSDLTDSNSIVYQALASQVIAELNKVGAKLYGSSFRRSIVNSFTNGSVVVSTTLVFANKTSVPSASNATSQLSSELTSNSSSLNILPGSVSATSSTAASTAAATATAATSVAQTSTAAPSAAQTSTAA